MTAGVEEMVVTAAAVGGVEVTAGVEVAVAPVTGMAAEGIGSQ